MVKKQQKLWAHYEKLKTILGTYITLFCFVPFSALSFSLLAHQTEINSGVQGAVKIAIVSGLKWYAIIMPIITLLFVIWFACFSGKVEFTDNEIVYYKLLFSKKQRKVPYNIISQCVFSDGCWSNKNRCVRGRKILIFNKKDIIIAFDLYYALCFKLILTLGEPKVKVMGDKYNFQTNNFNIQSIDNYYNVDFSALSDEDKIKILKHYCKLTKSSNRNLKKILK